MELKKKANFFFILSKFDIVLTRSLTKARVIRAGFCIGKGKVFEISRSGFKSRSALPDWFISTKFLSLLDFTFKVRALSPLSAENRVGIQ